MNGVASAPSDSADLAQQADDATSVSATEASMPSVPAAATAAAGDSAMLLSLVAPILVAVVIFLFFRQKSGGGGGRSVLLFGPVGSGKSALFHQLRYGRVVPTVSSMEPALAQFVPLGGAKGSSARAIHAVDVPGSGRLRARLLEEASNASALVCVVDGTQLGPQAKEAAGMIFEVLSHEAVIRRRVPLLVAVNKHDCAGAATTAAARKTIEIEVQRVRLARTTMEDTGGNVAHRGIASAGDAPFTFDELNHAVSFIATSATKPEVAELVAFAQKHAA